MPYLGDYLGHILAELAIARMQGDIETIRIAELYAAHPLLRSMPIPHVRLGDVDIDVPVLMERPEEPRAGESPRGSPSVPEMRRAFDGVLTAHLARRGVTVSAVDRRKLAAALDARIPAHSTPVETSVDVHRLADDLSGVAAKFLGGIRGSPPPEGEPRVVDDAELREAARIAFLGLRKPPPRLSVLVTSSEIREAASESVARIRLRISEHGVEWTQIEREGVLRDRLVPE